MNGFAVYYIEANVVCILVFGILLIHNHFNIDRQEKQIKFDHALLAFMFYFLVDCFWAAITDGLLPKTRFSVVSEVFLMYLFMAAITYFWLAFVQAYEQVPNRNRPINRFAVLFPFLIATAAMILNYLIAPQTLLNEALETKGPVNIYLVTVPCIYVAAVLFYTIRKAREEESPSEKRKHIFIGFLPLLVLVGGLVEIVWFPHLPLFCFCAMLLMLIFYIQSIELRISTDPLTQLNNRGQLIRYTSQRSNLYVEGRLTVVIMMDIDSFKAINDRYGHAEGDKALVIIADALKRAVNSHAMPSFLSRYGGDEFILIIHPVEMEETDALIAEIRREIALAERDTPYGLTISVGYDQLGDVQDSIQGCIRRADKMLYQDKANKDARSARAAAG